MPDLETVVLTAPHRRPMTFAKTLLIQYQITCYKNYEKLAKKKLHDKVEAEKINVSMLPAHDQEVIKSPEYNEFVEKDLDLASHISYPARKGDDDHMKVAFSSLSKPLKVIDGDYVTRAIGDPTDYQKYLEDFKAFNNQVGKNDTFMVGEFDEVHKVHQAISYIDHIEYRKKLSLDKFRKFSEDVGLKSQQKGGGFWFSLFGR